MSESKLLSIGELQKYIGIPADVIAGAIRAGKFP